MTEQSGGSNDGEEEAPSEEKEADTGEADADSSSRKESPVGEEEAVDDESDEPPADNPNQLLELIVAEVDLAESDYQNVRTRSISVAGISGGFISIVSASIALAAGSNKLNFAPLPARVLLVCALVSFVAAIVIAIRINRPTSIYALTPEQLSQRVEDDDEWNSQGWDRERARYLVARFGDLRKDNETKACLMSRAVWLEIAGIVLTAISALWILQALPTSPQAPEPNIVINLPKVPHRITDRVPNVVGQSEIDATSDLLNHGFTVEIVPVITTIGKIGEIARQSPAPGSKVRSDSVVTIDLSSGGNG